MKRKGGVILKQRIAGLALTILVLASILTSVTTAYAKEDESSTSTSSLWWKISEEGLERSAEMKLRGTYSDESCDYLLILTVKNSRTGAPVPGATVTVDNEGGETGQTDANGQISVRILRAIAEYSLTVQKSGYVTRTLTHKPEDGRTENLYMDVPLTPKSSGSGGGGGGGGGGSGGNSSSKPTVKPPKDTTSSDAGTQPEATPPATTQPTVPQPTTPQPDAGQTPEGETTPGADGGSEEPKTPMPPEEWISETPAQIAADPEGNLVVDIIPEGQIIEIPAEALDQVPDGGKLVIRTGQDGSHGTFELFLRTPHNRWLLDFDRLAFKYELAEDGMAINLYLKEGEDPNLGVAVPHDIAHFANSYGLAVNTFIPDYIDGMDDKASAYLQSLSFPRDFFADEAFEKLDTYAAYNTATGRGEIMMVLTTEHSEDENFKVPKSIYDLAVRTDSDLSARVYNPELDGDVWYEWRFDAGELRGSEPRDLELGVTGGLPEGQRELADAFAAGRAYLPLCFAHDGELPAPARFKAKNLAGFGPEARLDLYWIDPEKGALEPVREGLGIGPDGYIAFTLEHCSNYVLVESPQAAQAGPEIITGRGNVFPWWLLLLLLLLLLLILLLVLLGRRGGRKGPPGPAGPGGNPPFRVVAAPDGEDGGGGTPRDP